jgi:hypothetical protein
MKNNMKLLLAMMFAGAISFTSCKKDSASMDLSDPMIMEIATDEASVRLANSVYEEEIINELITANGQDYYTGGTIEYKSGNEVLAVVNFETNSNEQANLTQNGISTEFDLKKKKDGSKYKKVIVTPLVKTDDCDYIVGGIIKYYDYKTGAYLATIDYGNGICDEWAVKTWPAGSSEEKTWPAGSKTFSLDEWKSGGKK